jgi:hypothetical protein
MKRLHLALAPAALLWALSNGTIWGADPPLTAGNPVTIGSPQQFSGVGGTNTSGGAFTALAAFEAAIGGVKNIAASPQTGGFRTITWDGVTVDGTDFSGNTTVIVPNKIAGIPLNRFETQGVFFEEVYAVSTDGFKSVNSNVNAANPQLFAAFSPTRTFAMFNNNGIGLSFVLASPFNRSPQPAATRGFGAIFLNSRSPNATSIEYFNGARSLGKFFVPFGTQGQPEFFGVLFATPIVTRVQITCGTEAIFTFDGVTTSNSTTDNPAAGHNLVATDDFVYAEPVAATNAQPTLNPTAGSSFNGTVALFGDLDLTGVAGNFTAKIDWGDGITSPGLITSNANGGFNVAGVHTYAGGGSFPVTIDIADFLGSKLTILNTAVVAGTGQVLNISTRARVDTGDNVLFGGFIIGSATNTSKVIVRALGPSLTAFGVPGALTDPTLELHDGNGTTIATNDNWKVNDVGGSQQAEVEATTIPPTNDLESALVRTLAPGNYTAIVRGKNNGTGVALVEVYNLLQ